MKKTLSILLAFLMIAGSLAGFAGCSEKTIGDDKDSADAAVGQEQSVSSADVPNTEEETETEWVDPFTGVDFDGRSFRVYSSVDESDATNADKFIHGSDELTGEAVNDAVFNRNQTVSDLLNITFEFTDARWSYSDADAQLKRLIEAGTDEWDVMANDLRTLANLSRDGYIHNVAHSDILDLSRSYWYGDAMKDCQFVEGGMYLLIGDYFTDALQSAHCLYQNKSILNNVYGSENYITDMVFDGKWTYDAMIRVIEDTAQDLNGDGELTQGDDLFGFTCWGKWGSMVPFVIGTGIKFIEHADDGPRFCFNNERSVKILEKLNELFYANGAHSDLTNPSMQTLQGIFTNGMTTLLGYNRLGSMADFREVEFGMGPLLYPKLDETQTDYVSSLHDTTEVGAIPMTVPPENLDFCETVLEVACRETGRSVIPEWYENGLKIKYSAGQDDAKMIDLIHDSITDPFPIAYDSGMAGFMISLCFGTPLNNQSTDFASAYAQNVGAAEIAVQTAYDKFRENLENGN